MLAYVLGEILKLLHPFVPFITEEIYDTLYPKKTLMIETWPSFNKHRIYRKEEKDYEGLKEIVQAIRNLRNEMGVVPSKRINAYIIAKDIRFMQSAVPYLNKLAGVGEVTFVESSEEVSGNVSALVTRDAQILIPLGELVDAEKEIARIKAEILQTEGVINKTNGLLANAAFVAKAPAKLVENEKEKLKNALEKLEQLKDKLQMFE